MIAVTDRVLRLLDSWRTNMPISDWGIHVRWHGGEAENFRSSDGQSVWVKGEPKGWVADVMPFHPELKKIFRVVTASGVRLWIDDTPTHAFPGGVIDANNEQFPECVLTVRSRADAP